MTGLMNWKALYINCLMLFVGMTVLGCKPNYPGRMDDPEPLQEVVTLTTLDGSVSIENGIYDLEMYVRGTEGTTIAVRCKDESEAVATVVLHDKVWTKAFVRGIEVTTGKVSISATTLEGSTNYELASGCFKKVSERRTFIQGGDFSMLTQVEKNGGTYSDLDGNAGDCIELSAKNGMNLARLRLYNDPGNAEHYPASGMFAGVQDEADILALARRAKAAGMEIELTFHYSDYWTNGGEQNKPWQWKDLSAEELKVTVYDYTKSFLEKMVNQGTAPEYVSLGNEIQSGILFGRFENGKPTEAVNGYCSDMHYLASLLAEGSRAVREVCPEAKIIIHLTTSDNITIDTFRWFFSSMKSYNLDYDIIGASYYPFYGNFTIEQMMAWAETLATTYDKDFIFMETGFAWNTTLADGTAGQIANNKPYEDMTKEAQRLFLLNLAQQIKAGSGRILGYIYWDPIYIAAPNCGWKQGEKNVTGNSTLFDFSGKMLPAWEAIEYN